MRMQVWGLMYRRSEDVCLMELDRLSRQIARCTIYDRSHDSRFAT
jgi:hypothetical protein